MISLLDDLKAKVYKPLLDSCSGLALSVLNPFKEGDFIEIDGKIGLVENRGMRKTAIKTADGSISTVENSKFYFKKLHNLSTENIIRLDLKLTIHLDSDMKDLKSEILRFFQNEKDILLSPEPKIQVAKIHQQHIELLVKPWCMLDDFLELDAVLENRLKSHLSVYTTPKKTHVPLIPERKLLAS